MSKRLTELNDNTIEEQIVESGKPLLVDFWAAWCGPGKAIAPTLEELGDTYQNRATIGKLDVDANQSTASRYNVRAIPTLILFKDGQEQERLIGAQSKKAIADLLDRYAA
jgi:thioredoxin 1